jgi:hypothetical protein
MKEIAKAIYEIQATPGRNDKLALLERYAELPGFKDVLQFIYNPYIRTGIATNKLTKGKHSMCDTTITVHDAINILKRIRQVQIKMFILRGYL